jgi:AhpD family alkylhydroperoxidase
MASVPLVQYDDAPRKVKTIFDDIKRARNVEDVNNFWKALANQPETLERTWAMVREVMRPGDLDAVTKEMIYAAVSIANNCDYCIHSHTAAAFDKGMTESQYQELLAVVATAHLTNALANGFKVPVDERFKRSV